MAIDSCKKKAHNIIVDSKELVSYPGGNDNGNGNGNSRR